MSNIINLNDAKITKEHGGKIETIKDAKKKDPRIANALEQVEKNPSVWNAPTGTDPNETIWTPEDRRDLANFFREFYGNKKKN